jgi:hypothetical protein
MGEVIRETASVRSLPSCHLTSLTRTIVSVFADGRAGTTPTQKEIGATIPTMFPPELDFLKRKYDADENVRDPVVR